MHTHTYAQHETPASIPAQKAHGEELQSDQVHCRPCSVASHHMTVSQIMHAIIKVGEVQSQSYVFEI